MNKKALLVIMIIFTLNIFGNLKSSVNIGTSVDLSGAPIEENYGESENLKEEEEEGSLYKSDKFIIGKNMKESQNLKIDLNRADKGEMLGAGISSSYVEKIIEYREMTGGFEKLEHLKRISGIGEKSYKKIVEYFIIEGSFVKKKVFINQGDEKTLRYFGLNKKEIKSIMKNRVEGNYITNNIELKDSLNRESIYMELRDRIDYTVN